MQQQPTGAACDGITAAAADAAAAAPRPRVRTVTVFLELPSDEVAWEAKLRAAGDFFARAGAVFEEQGYEVQTLRVATQPFDRYLGPPGPALPAAAARLEALAHDCGVPMVSIGGADDPEYLPWIPPLLAATKTVSCSFALPPSEPPCPRLARRAAAATLQTAALTGGARNFGFAAAINCGAAGIPFFPVATACGRTAGGFGIGVESDGVLHAAFTAAAAASAAASAATNSQAGAKGAAEGGGTHHHSRRRHRRRHRKHGSGKESAAAAGAGAGAAAVSLADAGAALEAALTAALAPIERIAQSLAGNESGSNGSPQQQQQGQQQQQQQGQGAFRYLGIDSSIAPGLDTPPMTGAFESLGLGRFGGPGTLAACGMVTRALKALPLKLTGYCGLMLAVCEDSGLAAAAAKGTLSVPQLLQWSAVCGCGLDTVPVPGPGPKWAATYAAVEPATAAVTAAAAVTTADGSGVQEAAGGSGWRRLLPRRRQQRGGAGGSSGAERPVAAVTEVSAATAAERGAAGPSEAAGEAAAAPDAARADTTTGHRQQHKKHGKRPDPRDQQLLEAFTGVLLDTWLLSVRLNKPLAARLLPLPGRRAGEAAVFDSPYLLPSRVLPLR